MVKDLAAGKVYVTVNGAKREIPLAKCSKTGLLVINLTLGITREVNKVSPDTSPAHSLKFFTPFCSATCAVACVGDSGAMDQVAAQFNGETGLTTLDDKHDLVSVLTGGERTQITPTQCDGKVLKVIDVRAFHDPDGGEHRIHVGRNLNIIAGLVRSNPALLASFLSEAMAHVQDHGAQACVLFILGLIPIGVWHVGPCSGFWHTWLDTRST